MAPGTPSNQFLNGRAPQPNVQTSGARSANFNRDRDIPLCHLEFDSIEAFQTAFATHAPVVMADIANYTAAQPVIQIGEVKL